MCAISATACSNASALALDGLRIPATLRTYCSAAARLSSLVGCSVYGGRSVLMLRHICDFLWLLVVRYPRAVGAAAGYHRQADCRDGLPAALGEPVRLR